MCDFCNTYRMICAQMNSFVPDTRVHRCPQCGGFVSIDLELIEVDGEYLLYDRQSSPDFKPMDMKIDLDRVDISREWEMLMTNFNIERPEGYGDEYLKKKWEEFNREEETKTKPLTPEEFHKE